MRLGLEAKLEAAAVERHGRSYEPPDDLKHLPKGARAARPCPASCPPHVDSPNSSCGVHRACAARVPQQQLQCVQRMLYKI